MATPLRLIAHSRQAVGNTKILQLSASQISYSTIPSLRCSRSLYSTISKTQEHTSPRLTTSHSPPSRLIQFPNFSSRSSLPFARHFTSSNHFELNPPRSNRSETDTFESPCLKDQTRRPFPSQPLPRQPSSNFSPQGRVYNRVVYSRRPEYGRLDPPVSRESIVRRAVNSPRFFYYVVTFGAICGAVYISNLEVVPVTGRRRFNVVSTELEAKLAKGQFESTLDQYKGKILPSSDYRVRFCRRVLNRLLKSAGLEKDGVEWELFVVDEAIPNAFVIPGGKVFVFTGILPIAKTESALATVLGHEIAHTLARHSAERMSVAVPLLAFNYVASLLVGIPPFLTDWLLSTAFLMPGSRAQESEADYIGLLMMAQACYDPDEAIKLWTRMEKMSGEMGDQPPEFLSTHPSNENRVANFNEWMPEAHAIRQNSDCQKTSNALTQFWNKLGYAKF